MSVFTEFIDYVRLTGCRYRLMRPLRWEIGRKGSGLVYTVPAGFVFDVSVPWTMTWLIDPNERSYLLAAAIHDHMLADGWKKNTAAIEFYHGLRAMNVTRPKAVIMAAGVLLWTAVVDPKLIPQSQE